jgi:tetratricopeptide (TPR) repeat protein
LKKQQFILIGSGVVLLCLIYFFGNTVPPKKPTAQAQEQHEDAFDIQSVIGAAKKQLTENQQTKLAQLESAVVRGDVKEQQAKVYKQLASYWKDSIHALLPYAYYTAEAAKLENSEKSLTFAAHFFLEGVRGQEDPARRKWMALEAKELFEKALVINPASDSLKVGLGSCYLFGNISETPMEGISMIREVADRDPKNMYAQFMLGIGGMISGQLDKAIERLSVVAANQPRNPEVIVMLAEAYERKGDKVNAIKWYQEGKKIITNQDIVHEIDQRINQLKN